MVLKINWLFFIKGMHIYCCQIIKHTKNIKENINLNFEPTYIPMSIIANKA